MPTPQALILDDTSIIGFIIGGLVTLGAGVLTFWGVVRKSASAETIAYLTTGAEIQRDTREAEAAFRQELRDELDRREAKHAEAIEKLSATYSAEISRVEEAQAAEIERIETVRRIAEEQHKKERARLIRANRRMFIILRDRLGQSALEEISDLPEEF